MPGGHIEAEEEEDADELRPVAARHSSHPRAMLEQSLQKVVEELVLLPTVPLAFQDMFEKAAKKNQMDDVVVGLPFFHCPFKGCGWTGDNAQIQERHLVEEHQTEAVVAAMAALGKSSFSAGRQLYTVVNAAIAEMCAESPPLVSYSHDRRGLRWYYACVEGQNLQCLICFLCGCKYAKVGGPEPTTHIEWVKCQKGRSAGLVCTDFLGLSAKETETLFGTRTYVERYSRSRQKEGPDLTREVWKEEMENWTRVIPFKEGGVRILCTPEDRRCQTQHSEMEMCPKCEVPICKGCIYYVRSKRQPKAALANDLFTGYIPKVVYRLDATYMEMLLASPYVVSLICFVLEMDKEGRHGARTLMDCQAHRQRYRAGLTKGDLRVFGKGCNQYGVDSHLKQPKFCKWMFV